MTNGVKQGVILSPKLFYFYMDDLSVRLSEINVGGSIGGKRINHLFYADDVCLLFFRRNAKIIFNILCYAMLCYLGYA